MACGSEISGQAFRGACADLPSAAANPQTLNWKTSIVDPLSLDSGFEARRGLAAELGCSADKMGDSMAMNIRLHKTVLQKLAGNGGNIPRELLG